MRQHQHVPARAPLRVSAEEGCRQGSQLDLPGPHFFSSFPSSDRNWAKEASGLLLDGAAESESEASFRVSLP